MSLSRLPAFLSPLHVPTIGAIPTPVVHELLEDGEEWIWGEDGVGLYHSNSKMPYYQSLSVQLTTHRLLFLHSSSSYATTNTTTNTTTTTSSSYPSPKSLQLSLSNIRQTEFYTGFMRSSPKISLFLGYPDPQTDAGSTFLDGTGTGTGIGIGGESWTCTVCGFVNEPKSLGNVSGKCSLCGVTRVIGNSGELSRAGTPVSGNSTAKSGLITDEVTPGRPGTPGTLGIPSSSISPTSTSLNQIGQMEFAAPAAAAAAADNNDDDDDVVVHSRKETPCSRCTFLNHPSLSNCEICGSPLLVQRNIASSSTSSPTTTTTMTRAKQEGLKEVVRLSFRKGGEKEMYKRLKSVLEKKSWLGEISGKTDLGKSNGSVNGRAGIDGIIQTMSLESKAQEGKVQDAFQDLDALMIRAGEMVKLVQTLNSKLTAQQIAFPSSTTPDDDQTLIRSSLVQMGLPVPAITQDMVKGEQAYLEGLARELGALLTGGKERIGYMMVEGKGVVGLDEVWAVWNRLRGVSLVSPKDFRSSIRLLPQYTNPSINHLTHSSGLSVLHAPHFSLSAFSSRLHDLLQYPKANEQQAIDKDTGPGMTTIEIALHEKIAVGFAVELLTMVEMDQGSIARDAQDHRGGGEKWYINLISEFVWDDPNA